MKKLSIIPLFVIFLSSCEKVSNYTYTGGSGISLYYSQSLFGINADTLNYSFANQVLAKTQDTVFIGLRLNGITTEEAREISVDAADGTTATEGTHFILPKIILPAGAYSVKYPIVLLNTADLVTNTYTLRVKIAPNNNFVQGPVGTVFGQGTNIASFKIYFSNQLIRPDYWINIQGYFGAYSNVKYKFMITTLGISNFKPAANGGTVAYSDLLSYNGKLKNAQKAYELINGPLIDENGAQITFPL